MYVHTYIEKILLKTLRCILFVPQRRGKCRYSYNVPIKRLKHNNKIIKSQSNNLTNHYKLAYQSNNDNKLLYKIVTQLIRSTDKSVFRPAVVGAKSQASSPSENENNLKAILTADHYRDLQLQRCFNFFYVWLSDAASE